MDIGVFLVVEYSPECGTQVYEFAWEILAVAHIVGNGTERGSCYKFSKSTVEG